jgi:integrase
MVQQKELIMRKLPGNLYTPASHKTAYRGHSRQIAIGPKAQEILKKYLKRKLDEYCFTPAEATGEKRKYKARYNRDSYRRAITRGIKKHNEDEDNKTKIPHWHPHQLRHTAGTKVRRELGRDAARAFLGHKNPQITDDYAKVQDLNIANKAAAKLG